MEVNGHEKNLFGYQHYLKYFLLCFAEHVHIYRFRMTCLKGSKQNKTWLNFFNCFSFVDSLDDQHNHQPS